MDHAKVLFVDDERGIRETLPRILEIHGFEVTAVATVAEALALINSRQFEVLLTDLNIGEPGDGFTVVSAMRRTQPDAVTMIITGYPGFDTALEAIRRQVDHYIVKPANVQELITAIHDRLSGTVREHSIPLKRVSIIIRDHKDEIVDAWLVVVKQDAELAALPISDPDRCHHIPPLLDEMVRKLQTRQNSAQAFVAAKAHGKLRRDQGYTAPMIVNEARLLRRVIYDCIQRHLLAVEISYLIPDMVEISDNLDEQTKASVEAFLNQGSATGRSLSG